MTQDDLFEAALEEPTLHPRGRPLRIVLVDGHALAYRAYYAIQNLTTTRGEPVQAVYGFIKTLLKILKNGPSRKREKEKLDDHAVIVVFDAPVKTFRHHKYDGYKATRRPMPEDLPNQIKRIKKLVDLLGLTRLEIPGFEADDVIGTLAKRAEAESFEVRIVTSDRDSYQLISEHIKVITPDYQEVGPDEVLAKYGVIVEQWVDYRALSGDPSDNIPGAKGIGPKTAQKLLADYGSLDYIIDQIDQVKPEKVAEKIKESLEDVKISRELAQIVTDMDIEIDLDKVHLGEPDVSGLTSLLRELEFTSLMNDLGLENRRQIKVTSWQTPGEKGVFGFVLSQDNAVAAELTGLAFANPEEQDVVHQGEPDLKCLAGIKEISAADAKALATHALSHGLEVTPNDDPLLMAYVIDANNADPHKVSQRYLQEDWPRDAAGRAAVSNALLQVLPYYFTPKLKKLYEEIERPVAKVLAKMEANGVAIDAGYFLDLSEKLGSDLKSLESKIHDLAGAEFNINSRDQLEVILYDKLGLASGKKTKLTGKRSTAVSALEPLRGEHPIIDQLLHYRELAKLKSTYLDPLPALINPRTGRVHTTFSQTVTTTGRLASLNPNLQNIPVRSEIGREIRKGFIARPGYKLLAADYSQIELRILAHIAEEPELTKAFQAGLDIHKQTAATIFNIPIEKVLPEQRRAAKTINFGVLYGMGAHRLARDMDLPYQRAAQFIKLYFAAYPGIDRYLEQTKEFCREHGFVESLLGRRRYIPEINAKNFAVREAAERAAINMPIQSTNADIIKIAMVKLDPELEKLKARMLLQVHDELVIEVPENNVEKAKEIILSIMPNAFSLSLPIEVEVGIGNNWYEAKN